MSEANQLRLRMNYILMALIVDDIEIGKGSGKYNYEIYKNQNKTRRIINNARFHHPEQA